MSSLAATQADGYYVPVEYYESGAYKKLSKNQWHASQKKQKKSSNSNQQATTTPAPVFRFELPCNASCEACGSYISKGTRYNAEKRKTGEKYLTTPIYEFSMKCRICGEAEFVIRTNPKQRGFDYVKGLKKQQRNDPYQASRTDGNNQGDTDEEKEALDQLETIASGKRKTMNEVEHFQKAQQFQETYFQNDADSNAAVRTTFRLERKQRKRRLQEAKALGFREGIELADREPRDADKARQITFGNGKHREKEQLRKARASSIFFKGKQNSSKVATYKRKGRNTSRAAATTGGPYKPDVVTSSLCAVPNESNHDTKHDRQPVITKKLLVGVAALSQGLVTGKPSSSTSAEWGTKKNKFSSPMGDPTLTSIASRNATWSAMDALADYGSDSD